MRTCRALHGWRRYGKRSAARHAIPPTTISSENLLFSPCFRCSRKRHARQANRTRINPASGDKGIRGGHQEEIFEEEKDKEDGGHRCEEARQEDCREESEEDRQEGKKDGEETGCKEGRKKITEEGREESEG